MRIPELEPLCGSWICTRQDGQVVEFFSATNAQRAADAGWKVETALQYLNGLCDRPLAAHGWTSYRCRGLCGYIMIGAKSDSDALSEARRIWDGATADRIEVWNGTRYVPIPKN